jgi:hypothetical protein
MRRLLVFGQRHGVGFILMLVGFLLVGGPLSALAGVLPFLKAWSRPGSSCSLMLVGTDALDNVRENTMG